MPVIIAWIIQKLSFKTIQIVIEVAFFVALISFYTFIFVTMVDIYNLVQDFLSMIQNGATSSTDSVIEKMFGLLNCIGILDAFNATKSTILSSITFVFSMFFYKFSLRAKKSFVDQVSRLV